MKLSCLIRDQKYVRYITLISEGNFKSVTTVAPLKARVSRVNVIAMQWTVMNMTVDIQIVLFTRYVFS